MAHEVNVRNEEELIAFAQALNGLSNAMVQNFNKAKAEMYRVNEGWNDEQNQQFMQQFEQSVQVIKDRKSTRLNSSHWNKSRMPSSA